ncbi:MAG: M28 family metallopeptidase [Xanthomonadales bacterium]|nr:M28 family metallopeptidase [Xanthomonadales bacterium]
MKSLFPFSLPACRLLILLLILLLAACGKDEPGTEAKSPSVASSSPADAIAFIPSIDPDQLMATISELASDRFGGREPMSEGETLTLELIENRFRELGLQPLFDDAYRQAVDLVSIEADPASARMSFHLQDNDRLVTLGDEMILGTRRVAEESSVENSEVVFVGYGIVAPEYGWNDYADVNVQGKTVLILVNDPGFATQNPALFKGNTMTYYGRWTYKYEEAARQGAAAALIIHDTEPAAYGWDVVRNSATGPQFHLDRENNNMDRAPIESWIQRSVAEEIVAADGLDLDSLMAQAQSAEFKAVALSSTMDASVQNKTIKRQSYNVGAMLPGHSRSDEAFIYMAHWDHIGTNPNAAPGEDAIYNGAIDNASGIAALLALADAFSQMPQAPARSVAFLAVTAEESGLLGSAWYAEHPAIPLTQTVAGVNMDALGVYGPTKDIVVVGYGSSELEDILIQAAGSQERYVKAEEHPERGSYYRSDHFNFAKKGVPMLYAKSGSDHVEKGPEYLKEKGDYYLKNRYHSPADEVGDDWDLRGLAQDVVLYFTVGERIANSPDWPEWYEGNEFRAIRDQSRSSD